MEMSKQKKVLLGVVGVGLAVVALDRLVFLGEVTGGPTEASAATSAAMVSAPASFEPAAGRADTPAVDPAASRASASAGAVSVADQLRRAAEKLNLQGPPAREAFEPSRAWVGTRRQADEAGPRDHVADRFRSDHRLMGVMRRGDRPVAIVNGTPMSVGQRLDGFTLVSIDPSARTPTATFEKGTTRVELRLELEP